MDLGRVIVALDNMDKKDIQGFLKQAPELSFVKVGMELFYKEGPDFIRELSQNGKKIFLDLKLHDIPNTVAKAIKSLEGLPVEFLTVHLSGGREMLTKACEASHSYLGNAQILGVSYLTSLNELDFNELWGVKPPQIPDSFNRLFTLCADTQVPGLVLSAHELQLARKIEQVMDTKFIKVTPGIRFCDEIGSGGVQDQKRVLTPKEALDAGADYLVMGRSLTKSTNLRERLCTLSEL